MVTNKIQILYEDKDVLAINKPAGLLVHPVDSSKLKVISSKVAEQTVVDWLLKNYPEIKGVGDVSMVSEKGVRSKDTERSLERSGIVHRLDRETSGALIIAKNQKAFWYLKKQFQKGEVKKEYHAFVYGRVNPRTGADEGVIDRPIARSRRNPALWSATRGRKGKERPAVTEYHVLKRAGAHTLLALFPRTGRTHQLRVHLKAINYPVVCDKLYAAARSCELGFKRLALHSRSLSFLKLDGTRVSVEAPYPADFAHAVSLITRESTSSD